MGERRGISTDKLARGAAATGLAAGLVAALISGTGTAHAWCVGLSGLDIGDGCDSTLGNFALGLGADTVAHSNGLLTGAIAFGNGAVADTQGILTAAWAGGTDSKAYSTGIIAWAMSQGNAVEAYAGLDNDDIANFAFNFGNAADGATNKVRAGGMGPGYLNVAANIGGNGNAGAGGGVGPQNMDVFAGEGVANAALNFGGNRNRLYAGGGFLNLATTVGNLVNSVAPNGSDNDVDARGNLTLAFNYQPPFITEACDVGPCGNKVSASPNLAVAVAIGLVKRTVIQDGVGIEIKTPLNPPDDTTVLASNSKPATLVGSSTTGTADAGTTKTGRSLKFSPTGGNKHAVRAGRLQVASVLKSVNDQVARTANKVSNSVSKATGKLTGGARAGAAKTSGGESGGESGGDE